MEVFRTFKMNEIVNKFSSAGDKFMPEIHLNTFNSWITYSAYGPFTKNKGRTPNFKGTADSRYIFQNELAKACFQHARLMEILKIQLEKQLLIKYDVIKNLILLKIRNMIDINVDLLQWSTSILIKRILVMASKMRIFRTKN